MMTVQTQIPSIGDVIAEIRQAGMFAGIGRYSYTPYDFARALQTVKAIGETRARSFEIDGENRFAYENIIRWAHGDPAMRALNPDSGETVPGRLSRGIYIAGNSGTGKSWLLEIMRAYVRAMGFRLSIQAAGNVRQVPLAWQLVRADEICNAYSATGDCAEFRRCAVLGIQDLGVEPEETLYMGNRVDVIRQVINNRGDRDDKITLITSNYKLSGRPLLERYGDKVVSRLYEMCNYFEIKGRDRRKAYL